MTSRAKRQVLYRGDIELWFTDFRNSFRTQHEMRKKLMLRLRVNRYLCNIDIVRGKSPLTRILPNACYWRILKSSRDAAEIVVQHINRWQCWFQFGISSSEPATSLTSQLTISESWIPSTSQHSNVHPAQSPMPYGLHSWAEPGHRASKPHKQSPSATAFTAPAKMARSLTCFSSSLAGSFFPPPLHFSLAWRLMRAA